MFSASLAIARTWAAQSGQPFDLVPCGTSYSVVPATMADDLYPGRAVYRVQPDGDGVNLNDQGAR